MNEIARHRCLLRDAIADRVHGQLDDNRVSEYVATATPTPRIYIGSPRLGRATQGGAEWTIASYPVVIDLDGADIAQLTMLDELVARVWEAAWSVPFAEPRASNPTTVDVTGAGTPSTRRQTVDVEIAIGRKTLCSPNQEDSSG